MKDKLLQTYKTARLTLAPVTIDDAPDMYEYASDSDNAYYVFKTNETLAETKSIIKRIFIENGLGKYGIF